MRKNKTILEHILLGLIPYTKENIKLAYSPNAFFNEMERLTGSAPETIRVTMSRARQQGYITGDLKLPRLTRKGLKKTQYYTPQNMPNGYLMVIFDIPDDLKLMRDQFRYYLKIMQFKQTQKSVWTSEYDHKDNVKEIINRLDLNKYIQVFECVKLKI